MRKLIARGDKSTNLKVLLGICESELGHEEEACNLFRECAEQGDRIAQFKLGMAFILGKGVEKDIETAVFWLHKSDNQGYEDAGKVLEMLHRR